MFKNTPAFNGFSVDNIDAAKEFYGTTLGIEIVDDKIEEDMGFSLQFFGGGRTFVYPKESHEPATFTILNFVVDDIDTAVDQLVSHGVVMEHYENMPFQQDEKGVARGRSAGMGPDIAWFKDPAGNTLAILQN